MALSNEIHPTAFVSSQARLGDGNRIGPHVIIEDDVQLGDSNEVMTGVVLKNGTRLGHENMVHEYAVIGGLPQDLGFDKAMLSYVEIGNRNTLREYVTVNRASQINAATILGDENYLMNLCHLAHDCRVGNNVIMAPDAAVAGFVDIDDRAFISGGVKIHQFVQIGRFAMVGGNAKITQDALPFTTTDGIPARAKGLNIVGLRRGGFGRDDIKVLKQAYKLITRSGQMQDDILNELRTFNDPLTEYLADFITRSKRGYHREK